MITISKNGIKEEKKKEEEEMKMKQIKENGDWWARCYYNEWESNEFDWNDTKRC